MRRSSCSRLADHLDLDWAWLTDRCAELGRYGSAGMLRPRSRLIGLAELDDVLSYVGELGAGDPAGREAADGDLGVFAGAVTGGNRTQFRPDRHRGGRR